MVEVYNSHDCCIGLSRLIENEKSFDLTETGDITIDNIANKETLPKITITANATTTLVNISNGDKNIQLDLSLATNDELILDFNEQTYTLNNQNIMNNITLNSLLSLLENEETIFTFNFTGDITVKFNYQEYEMDEKIHYVQQMRISESKTYDKNKPFNSNKTKNLKVNNINYSFNIVKMSTKWIDTENEFRISFYVRNEDTFDEEWKYLIGVVFNRVEQKTFNDPNEIFKDNISGEGIDILTIN